MQEQNTLNYNIILFRKKLKNREMHFTFCGTKRMFVDILTKKIPKMKHVKYRSLINVSPLMGKKKNYVKKFHNRDVNINNG